MTSSARTIHSGPLMKKFWRRRLRCEATWRQTEVTSRQPSTRCQDRRRHERQMRRPSARCFRYEQDRRRHHPSATNAAHRHRRRHNLSAAEPAHRHQQRLPSCCRVLRHGRRPFVLGRRAPDHAATKLGVSAAVCRNLLLLPAALRCMLMSLGLRILELGMCGVSALECF